MEKIIHAMMELIASEVCGKSIDKSRYSLTDEELAKQYKLSKSHDLAHLVGDALIKNDLIEDGEIKAKFQKQIMLAVYRYEKINYELGRLRKVLNEAEIPFIPLKGSVLRRYYPEPWMRTSCDIDVLVHEEAVDQTAQIIVEKLGYTYEKKQYHDISLMSDGGVHLELHHSIKENKANIDALLSECWDYATVLDGYECEFTNEFFFFHQIAHASYHFLYGGCGVRPILDLYLLQRKMPFDSTVLDEMLERSGIKKFFDAAKALSEVWFGGSEHTDVTRRMEDYLLRGGVYGSTANSMAVGQQKEKGRLGYIINRIWLPYELLCITYPRLKGRKYLQLFYEIKRWLRIFNPEARKHKRRDLDAIKKLSAKHKSDVNCMLNELGLM